VQDAAHPPAEWDAAQLSCTARDDRAGSVCVAVSGELDLVSAPVLEATLTSLKFVTS
jgi:hypothetical protein